MKTAAALLALLITGGGALALALPTVNATIPSPWLPLGGLSTCDYRSECKANITQGHCRDYCDNIRKRMDKLSGQGCGGGNLVRCCCKDRPN
ncbi:hypothetical protein QBC35DRAFT_454592 [Podospora australis]|uniref:Uncharacterized protein n=1 Tax=Podospora australis TaxID=1536484 RepID=A0AAN6WNJ0_9PEZI|nr:hypothetical protein QBC35DRAFT_454592 [Podospora australis]